MLTAFLAVGVAWLAAGAVAAVLATATDAEHARWLALHFAFVGGISQLVVGAGQFFACAYLATSPPGRSLVRAELAVWNAAAVAIAIGVPGDHDALTGLGGALLLAGLALFARELLAMRRRSLQAAPWATRWYLTAALCLACGAALGPVMAGGALWRYGSLLGAHLVLNLGGWFGTAIVGTLHTFFPSLTQTTLRRPRLQAPTYGLWVIGIATLATGEAFASDAVAVGGWLVLLAAALLLAANLVPSALAAASRAPAMVVVAAGQVLLVAAVAAGLQSALGDGAVAAVVGTDRERVALLLVGGWIGLTVAGSLLHLLGVMGRVRNLAAPAREAGPDPLVVAATAMIVAGLLLAAVGPDGGRVLVALGYAGIAVRLVPLTARAVRAAPLRV